MDNLRLKLLFHKYIKETITEAERREFFALVAQPEAMQLLHRYAEDFDESNAPNAELSDVIASSILSEIFSKEKREAAANALFQTKNEQSGRKKRKRLYLKICSAAAVLLLFALYLYSGNKERRQTVVSAENQVIKDALPGHAGAVLTLSSGKTYLLDTMRNGMLRPGIQKSTSGISLLAQDEEVYYATLETPYGRSQQLLLSDGTRVWLNAGSSLRFPSVFKGHERRVELSGEAYFEVVHNDRQPFIVLAGNDEIRDLGTHFNVKAYCDDPVVKTTLLEGSVQIGPYILQPGQQYANGEIKKVNTEAIVAWVSGFFYFEDADIKTVMDQLGRWYNVQVKYAGPVTTARFEGEIQRSLTLSQVLKLIAATGVHYTLDGDQITIRP